MNADHVDRLVAGLARVHEEALRGTAASPEARQLFERIIVSKSAGPRVGRRVALAAAAAAALLAAPALALRGEIAHLFASREPAPGAVAKSFETLERGAPQKWTIAGAARLVLEVPTPDGRIRVWAAPRPVGFCYAVGTAGHEGFASTCVEGSATIDVWPFTVTKPAAARIGGPFVLVGFSSNHDARFVEIRFDNGDRERVPLTWISTPIDAGFFALPTAKAHWLDGKERFEATALDGSGDALGSSSVEVGVPTG